MTSKKLPTHGGSLRIYAGHTEAGHVVSDSVGQLLEEEVSMGLTAASTYEAFQRQTDQAKYDFLRFLIDAKERGKVTVGYGAPAKGNTFLNYAGIRRDLIEYTVDRSPQKQGRYLPGSRLPILAPDAITSTKPDYVIILPWNLRDEIVTQLASIRSWGGKFVVAIPALEVF